MEQAFAYAEMYASGQIEAFAACSAYSLHDSVADALRKLFDYKSSNEF